MSWSNAKSDSWYLTSMDKLEISEGKEWLEKKELESYSCSHKKKEQWISWSNAMSDSWYVTSTGRLEISGERKTWKKKELESWSSHEKKESSAWAEIMRWFLWYWARTLQADWGYREKRDCKNTSKRALQSVVHMRKRNSAWAEIMRWLWWY